MSHVQPTEPGDGDRIALRLLVIAVLTVVLGLGLLLTVELVQDRIAHADRAAGVVDGYRMVERAVKYGIGLVIATFGVFFLLETFGKARVQLMHYVSVGLALLMFYLLLVSLYEVIGFTAAYLIAAGMVASLNAFYLSGNVARGRHGAAAAFTGMAGLYAVTYFLLAQAEHALLIGTLVGFAILAAFMTTTRKVDWGRPRG